MVDANQNGIYLKDCRHLRIVNTECYEDTYNIGVTLENTRAIKIVNGTYGRITIDSASRGTVLENVQSRMGITDEAPDTQYLGTVWRRGNTPKLSYNTKGPDRRNLLDNALFNRWQSDRPDGWDVYNLTWTQCGVGLADTTNHASDYSAKMTTSGGTATSYYTLTSAQMKAVAGKIANFTIWGKIASGQTFTSYPIAYIYPYVPTWTGNTAFQVGEAVKPTTANSRHYICVTAGTTGSSEPTWPTTAEQTVTDGSVVWQCVYDSFSSFNACPFTSDDIGKWKRVLVAGYIPKNVTQVKLRLLVYRQADDSEATVYWAEPCLMTGWQGPDSIVQGQDEHLSYITIGGNRMTWGSAAPTSGWWKQGDVCWNAGASAGGTTGWVCVSSGTPGTWKAMANLAN